MIRINNSKNGNYIDLIMSSSTPKLLHAKGSVKILKKLRRRYALLISRYLDINP